MTDHCCQHKAEALTQLKQRQARVLWAVLGINLVMFVVEFGAGLRAASLSLTGIR
jgi:Co/Zn/Cd efflux system component